MKFIAYYDSPLGKITLAGDEAGLCGLWFEGEKYYAHALAASGADKKQSSADLLTKKQHTASETQRDLAALKKSKKSNIAAEATSSTDGKFCARDIATKTDTAAREGCYERGGVLETKSGADKKWGDDDLLAKEQRAASETQRDFAALEKSEKSDFAAKATNDADEKYNTRDFAAEAESGADAKFCAHTLIASEKFFTRDFAAYDAGKNLAPPIFRRKAGAENSAQTSKADTSRRETWPFSIKLGAGSICILADASRVLRPL